MIHEGCNIDSLGEGSKEYEAISNVRDNGDKITTLSSGLYVKTFSKLLENSHFIENKLVEEIRQSTGS